MSGSMEVLLSGLRNPGKSKYSSTHHFDEDMGNVWTNIYREKGLDGWFSAFAFMVAINTKFTKLYSQQM